MSGERKLRVLHCPTATGGNPGALARAERRLGLDSVAIAFEESPFRFPVDEVLVRGRASLPRIELARAPLLWRALRDFDVIHFNFGQTIAPVLPMRPPAGRARHLFPLYRLYTRCLEMRDLPLLSLAGKGIVVTFYGSDARQSDYCREHFELSPAAEAGSAEYSPGLDARRRRRIAKFDRYADKIYAFNPDLMRVLPGRAEFLPYASVDPDQWKAIPPREAPARLVVLHAPTDRRIKGTRHIVEAVGRLREEGLDFEFKLVEGVANEEAKRLYEGADILVDQLLLGWYGGLALEFMALGKPVISYIRETDLAFVPDEMRKEIPTISATPATVYGVLKELLTVRRGELARIGRLGRAYAEKWHDPIRIASRLKAVYEEIISSKKQARR